MLLNFELMEFNEYVVFTRQNAEVLPFLKFRFEEIFTAIYKRLNVRPDIFIHFFQVVPDYKIQLGMQLLM